MLSAGASTIRTSAPPRSISCASSVIEARSVAAARAFLQQLGVEGLRRLSGPELRSVERHRDPVIAVDPLDRVGHRSGRDRGAAAIGDLEPRSDRTDRVAPAGGRHRERRRTSRRRRIRARCEPTRRGWRHPRRPPTTARAPPRPRSPPRALQSPAAPRRPPARSCRQRRVPGSTRPASAVRRDRRTPSGDRHRAALLSLPRLRGRSPCVARTKGRPALRGTGSARRPNLASRLLPRDPRWSLRADCRGTPRPRPPPCRARTSARTRGSSWPA